MLNKEQNVMNDAELESVAGGTRAETAEDSRFLNCLNGSCDRYGADRIWWTAGYSIEREVRNAWKTVGVTMNFFSKEGNDYFIDGRRVGPSGAKKHAMKVTGHYMKWRSWNWS